MGAKAGKAARSYVALVRQHRLAFQQQPGPDTAASALNLVANVLSDLDSGHIEGSAEQVTLLRQLLNALHQEVLAYITAVNAPIVPVPVAVPVPVPVLQQMYAHVNHPGTRYYAAQLLQTANAAGGYQAPVPGANLAAAQAAVLSHLPGGGGGDYGNAVRGAVPDIVTQAYQQGYDVNNPALQPILASLTTEYISSTYQTTIGSHTGGGLRGM
jgi:hypothetical protein